MKIRVKRILAIVLISASVLLSACEPPDGSREQIECMASSDGGLITRAIDCSE